jgi:hypothetical protein
MSTEEELQVAIAECEILKEQIEKLKNCYNCKHETFDEEGGDDTLACKLHEDYCPSKLKCDQWMGK